MQSPHRTTPFDLPELVAIIIRYLGFRDKIACLFVCRKWHESFRDHVFGEQVLHTFDTKHPARLQAVGRYARDLRAYFAISEADLDIVATHCPNILAFDVEVDEKVSDEAFETFMERVSIQHLVLRIRNGWNTHKRLASATRLTRIKSLELRGCGPAPLVLQPERLLTFLQAMPTLSSLVISVKFQDPPGGRGGFYPPPPLPPQKIPDIFLTDKASSSSTPGERVTISPTPITFLARLNGFFKRTALEEGSLEAAQEREPWRTFIPRLLTEGELRIVAPVFVPASHALLHIPLDHTTTIPSLTTLHIVQESTVGFDKMAGAFFPLLPNLRELVLDFGDRRDGSSRGLAAVNPSCPHLQCITISSIDCVSYPSDNGLALQIETRKAMVSFLSSLPSTLRELSLKRIFVYDSTDKSSDMLLHIPSETRKRLQKLVAENLRHRQAATHEFLVGCQALRELRLAEFLHLQGVRDLAAGTPPHIQTPEYYTQNELYGRSDHFLGSILEPWGCTWTLECIDLEGYPIVEQEAMVAWLDRLVWMPHLTKLAISVHQARLMLQVCRRGIPSVSSTDKVQLQHVWQLRLSMTRVTRTPQDNSFAPVHWSEGTLNESELRELLEMMPRIHSLRYIGKAYPLFHDATRWLETHRPHLQLLHVLQ